MLFTTPKGTGVHIIATTLPAGWNSIVALISSPQSNAYSVDNTDPLNPTLVFDASKASEGESGIAGIGEDLIVKLQFFFACTSKLEYAYMMLKLRSCLSILKHLV